MSKGRGLRGWLKFASLGRVLAWRDSRREAARALPRFWTHLEELERRLIPSVTVTPSLVADINPGATTSTPSRLTNVSGTLFFTANDGSHGEEVFKSDGAGAILVQDINPGSAGSAPNYLTNVNGTLFFKATDGSSGYELWKTDGTSAGTTLVRDINPGSDGSAPVNLTNVNGTLFFRANDGSHGRELWKSDGTSAGTTLVQDIYPGSGNANLGFLTNVNGTLFFSANDASHGNELWKSDGTSAGTQMVQDINLTGASSPAILTNVNGTLFFRANDGSHGAELWKSDGTSAGTVLVQDIKAGAGNSNPSYLTNVNGTLFFQATDGSHGYELWQSDGTSAGTVLVRDINPGSADSLYYSYLTNVNGTLFFQATDGSHGYELWKSDGTSAGTVLVQDIKPGSGSSNLSWLANVNGTLFFQANDGSHGYELWQSDGTSAGTMMVQDINSGSASSSLGFLTNVNGTLFFTANDGSHGVELWKATLSDPRAPALVKDINPGSIGSTAYFLTNVNGTLFFQANDGSHGRELWKSDGTATGTVMVQDIFPGSKGSTPRELTNVNGTLFFQANDGSHGVELWKSDGTTATLVQDIQPGSLGSNPQNLTNLNGTLFFIATDGSHGYELWKSDGSSAGTLMVLDINPDASPSAPTYLTNVNGTLFFEATDGSHGYELWKSDGSSTGTVMVLDINPGAPDSSPKYLTNVNGMLFFRATDGSHGYELWKSDGSSTGTQMVLDIRPGNSSSTFLSAYLTNVNGTLFFKATDGSHGYELWKSDGSSTGTVLVRDINPGGSHSYPRYLTNVNGTLFFSATDGSHGRELWKSDGTSAGTTLVQDIYPGSNSSYSRFLTNVNGTLFFEANDGSHGLELWKSDGTSAGTTLVQDINPGSNDSTPHELTNVNGTLFFRANDGSHGAELWALEPSPFVSDPGFELPNVGTGFQYAPAGSPWTFTGGAGVAGNGSGFTSGHPAPQGTQVAFLQTLGSVSQVLTFASGVYTVSFQAAQRSSFQASIQTIAVLIDGKAIGTFTPPSTGYTTLTTAAFTLGTGTHTLAFQGMNPNGGDNTAFLDQVAINQVATFSDPGFETPPQGIGIYHYGPSGSPWTFVGAGLAGNASGWNTYNAPQGAQVAFLQQSGSISQQVYFATGGTWSVGFLAAQRPGNSETFQVLMDGATIGTFNNLTGSAYTAQTTPGFTVTAGTHLLKFQGTNLNTGDNSVLLDQVALNLVTNGLLDPGFEMPVQGTGNFQYGPSGSPWTFSGSSGLASNSSGWNSNNAPQGSQVAFLQTTGSVSQQVNFTAGGAWTVSFLAAQRSSFQSTIQSIQVLIDGTAIGTFTPPGSGYNALTTAAFTVTAGTHTLTFQGLNPNGGDNTALIDQVSLNQVAAFSDFGFETPSEGTGNFNYGPGGSPWTFVGAGLAGNSSGWNPNNAPQGAQVAFLQQAGSISQQVNFASGGTYTVSFLAAQRPGNSETFQVLMDGNVVGTFNSLSGSLYTALTTASFTVTAGNHLLKFQGTNLNTGDNSVLLDQVAINVFLAGFTDPGFETPALSANTFQYNPGGSAWTFSASSGLARNNSGWNTNNAPQGSQVAFLQGTGSVSQQVNFATGGTCLVGLSAAQRSSGNSSSQTLQVLIDGHVVGTLHPAASNYTVLLSTGFTVSSGSHTLTIQGLNPNGGDNTALIDQVFINLAS